MSNLEIVILGLLVLGAPALFIAILFRELRRRCMDRMDRNAMKMVNGRCPTRE